MKEIISKEELEELLKIEGKVRGGGMKSYAEYILREEGKDGLEKLEDAMAKLGYPIKYKKIRELNFFPVKIEAITLVVIKKIFNYGDDKFREMAKFAIKLPFIIRRVFMSSIFQSKKIIEKSSEIWSTYYSMGNLEVASYSTEKRKMIVRLKNFRAHPLHCQLINGYISNGVKMIIKKEVICTETKCTYKGDDYHEFLLKW